MVRDASAEVVAEVHAVLVHRVAMQRSGRDVFHETVEEVVGETNWSVLAPYFGLDGHFCLNGHEDEGMDGGEEEGEEEGTGGDVLVVLTLHAGEVYRGQGLGLLLVKRLVDTFSASGLMLLRAGTNTDIDVGASVRIACWDLLGLRVLPSVQADIVYLWFQGSTPAPSLTLALAGFLAKRATWQVGNATADEANPCSNPGCGGTGLKICTRCRQARYCGPQCQQAHWSMHKTGCKASKEA
jgi:GNAT superfamily N-acetyltransferase